MDDLRGMHPVVCHHIANGAVYTTTIYMDVNKVKSILMYHHSLIVQSCSAKHSRKENTTTTTAIHSHTHKH
jgi:transcription initiation factor IIE alpha subunit